MSAQYIRLYPENPDLKKVAEVGKALRDGAVIIYPTDTVYGIGCDFSNVKAVQRICQIKNTKPDALSIICYDLSEISLYTKQLSTTVFKVMKKHFQARLHFC